MPFRCLIKKKPQHQQAESESSCDQERRLPAERQLQPDDQWRRQDRADRNAAVEDGHPEGAFADGKPFRHDLRRSRPIARFTKTQQKTKKTQTAQSPSKRVGHGSAGPYQNRNAEAAPSPNAVVELARQSLAHRIGHKKPNTDAGKLEIG